MDLYFKIKQQRNTFKAPVDLYGCSSIANDKNDRIKNIKEDASNAFNTENDDKFKILLAVLFSSQTKDEITFKAIKNLENKLKIISPKNILNSKKEDILESIKKIGFANKKLKFLYEISELVKERMPDTLEEVLKLPGIGIKMANLYMLHALGINKGIAVDTHVIRISNRLKLVHSKEPERIRKELEKVFEIEEWPEVNRTFVGFGQVICKAKPKCEECIIKDECPYNRESIKNSSRNNKLLKKVI